MKPLDQALKDGDHIRALIAGSGMNQDGRTNGITMPNGDAQVSLMKSVYKKHGLDPRDTGYIEAHGTGTKVGDPIEATALHEVFGEGRSSKQPLFVGSVKSNIGHLEGASGVVSIIKTAMMLEKGFVLPNHNFEKGNPKIPFDEWHLKVCLLAEFCSHRSSDLSRFSHHNGRGLEAKDTLASTISASVAPMLTLCWNVPLPLQEISSLERMKPWQRACRLRPKDSMLFLAMTRVLSRLA